MYFLISFIFELNRIFIVFAYPAMSGAIAPCGQ